LSIVMVIASDVVASVLEGTYEVGALRADEAMVPTRRSDDAGRLRRRCACVACATGSA